MINKYKKIKTLTSAIIIGTNLYTYPSLSSDFSEDVHVKAARLGCEVESFDTIFQNITTLHISSSVKNEFELFAQTHATAVDVYQNPNEAAGTMGQKLKELLPQDIQETLRKMGRTGEPGIIHLTGLPTDSFIPLEGSILERVNAKSKVSESVMLGLSYVMGCEARPNPNEQEGRIIHNIAPIPGFENVLSSRSRDPFYLHTENAYEETPPDFLMLYSLVGDTKSQTSYHFVKDFMGLFSENVLKSMRKKQFKIVDSEV